MNISKPSPNKWYLKATNNLIHVWNGEILRTIVKGDKEITPGPVSEVKKPESLTKKELKRYYGSNKPKKSDVIIIFQKDSIVVILDQEKYEELSNIPGKIDGGTVDGLIRCFDEHKRKCATGKRKRDDSPPPPREKYEKWATKSTAYQQATSAAVAQKRIVHGTKDVFKIPLDKIEVSQRYQTRQLNNIFVDDIKDAMLQELSLDSVVYVASVGNPFHDNHLLKEESSLYILGGTHYLSALRKLYSGNSEKCVVNAAIYSDLTEEEVVWLGNQHNKQQRLTVQMSAREYITNFRRLYCQSHDVDDIDPPANQPKDWRIKCQLLLPEGKSINSYSPWLAISKVDNGTWSLVRRIFDMFENGEVKGMKKKGKTLESHRLWKELASLTKNDTTRVLQGIVEKRFSICEAIQDAENRKRLVKVRKVIEEQLSMDWPAISEHYGSRVNAEALLPYARLEHVERIPAYLGEFISSLMESNCDSPDNLDADCLFTCEDLRVRTMKGTALDPPSLKANVILVECGVADDSFEKDELRLIIQKTTCRQCQRQLFVVETTFTLLPDLQALGAEMKLAAEVVIVREEKFGVHKITDTTLPIECYPVIIFKKTSDAVPQTYNLPLPGQGSSVTNLFGSTSDLLRVVCFPGDTVLDTSLDADKLESLSCKEVCVIGSEDDIKLYKQRMSDKQINISGN